MEIGVYQAIQSGATMTVGYFYSVIILHTVPTHQAKSDGTNADGD